MNKIARIGYLNTTPFFYDWPEENFPLKVGSPRRLADVALDHDILAGPLPVFSCWDLEYHYESLGHYGIAVKEKSRSVFLLSKEPITTLNSVDIGLTPDSSTSVQLLKILIEKKYKHEANFIKGFTAKDQGRLIIGDAALKFWVSGPTKEWPYVTDLATEWWNWQNLPFVFAKWVILKETDILLKEALLNQLQYSLAQGIAAIPFIAQQESEKCGLSPEQLTEYLNGFTYRLGNKEYEAIQKFRKLVEEPVLGRR